MNAPRRDRTMRGLGATSACLGLVALLTACGSSDSGGAGDTWPRCYSLDEGGSVATIRLEPREVPGEPQGGQITVYSTRDGREEFPPETTIGRLTPTTFVYADGTSLSFDEDSLRWPEDSVLQGAVFTVAGCP